MNSKSLKYNINCCRWGILILTLWLSVAQADYYRIYTIAGNGTPGYSGDGGSAIEAQIQHAREVVVDKEGNLYVADVENHRVRQISKKGIITTVVGGGSQSEVGEGVLAIDAQLNRPIALALDKNNNLYILENSRVLRVDHDKKTINRVAGTGQVGYNGEGPIATETQISAESGDIAIDGKGNLYLADRSNHCIRQVMLSQNQIKTFAGICNEKGYSGDGGSAIKAKLNRPEDIVIDADGKVFIADSYNAVIRLVNTHGIISHFAGVAGKRGYSGDGGDPKQAKLNLPIGLALDKAGNLYLADFYNHRIRQINSKATVITTIAGNGNSGRSDSEGGVATETSLFFPEDVAWADDALYFSDKESFRLRKLELVKGELDNSFPYEWLILSSLALLMALAFYYLRFYRHPIVLALSADSSQLLKTPLEQLAKTKYLLKRTHRLDSVLSNNEVSATRLEDAINFATMPKTARCELLANRLNAVAQATDNADIFKLQLSRAFPLNLSFCYLYFPPANLLADEIIQVLQEQMSWHVTLVISLEASQQAVLRPKGEDRTTQWLVANNRELTEILLSPKPIEVFVHLLAYQLEIINLSLYQTGGGVSKDILFFGREKLLVPILNREPRNYLMIGGRQLGKSSLLKKIERHYQNHPKIECRYLSLLGKENLLELAAEFDLPKETTLPILIEKLAKLSSKKQHLLLFDEVDLFIRREIANNYPTLSRFRNLSEEGRCYFILAGFWELYEAAILDYHSPIVNFGESLIVGALEAEACRELVTQPMAMLGIRYASDNLVEQIITATGQRANLVAIVCHEMLKNLASEKRTLDADEVRRALDSETVQRALLNWTRLSNNESAARLDRIVVYATIERNEFGLYEVMRVLNEHDYVYTTEQVKNSLARLELAYIIRREGNRYTYCVPLFRKMLMELGGKELEELLAHEFQ